MATPWACSRWMCGSQGPVRRPRWATLRRVLVDTGARRLGSPKLSFARPVWRPSSATSSVMANGQYVTRHVGVAVIECGEFKTVDEVVFAQPGDLSLLGARTLEGFNAQVDSRKRNLVAAGPIPAAGS